MSSLFEKHEFHWGREGPQVFPSKGFLVLVLLLLLPTKARLRVIVRWNAVVPPAIYSIPKMQDHDSLFKLPDLFREAERPIKATRFYYTPLG